MSDDNEEVIENPEEQVEESHVDEQQVDDNLDDSSGDDEHHEDDPAPKPLSRAQRDIIATRERAQAAEKQLAEAKAELEAARRAAFQPQQPTEDQRIWQQEEEALRNPELSDWQRYSINAARSARLASQTSTNALRRAEDLADKAAFDQYKITKPKLYETFKDKVEEKLKEFRANGGNPPREKVLALCIGEATLEGKLKPEAKKSEAPRRSTPGVRSDVSASSGGRMTDAEKRAKRLENIRI